MGGGGGPFVSEQSPRTPGSHICLAVFLPLNSICASSLLPQLPTKPGIRNIPSSFLPPLLYRGIHLPHSITNGKIAAPYPSPWLKHSLPSTFKSGSPGSAPYFLPFPLPPAFTSPAPAPRLLPCPQPRLFPQPHNPTPSPSEKKGGGKAENKQASKPRIINVSLILFHFLVYN